MKNPSGADGIRTSHRFVAASVAIVFGVASAINIYCLIATWHPLPLWDHWETVTDYQHYLAGGFDWGRLVAQHNEHRMVFSNLLNLADYRFFQGLGLFLIVVNVTVSCLSVGLVYHFSGANRLGLRGMPALLFYLAAGTSVTQIANLSWPFQTAWFVVLAFAILSFRAYQSVIVDCPGGLLSTGWLLATWALAAAATFSNANGLVTWFVLLMMGLVMRYPRRVQFGTLIVGGLVIVLYFLGFHAPNGQPPLSLAFFHPLDFLEYATIYAGNALQSLGLTLQIVFGAVLVVYLIVESILVILRSGEAFSRDRVFPLGVAAFLLGTVAMTGVGRLGLGGPLQANATRYATFSLFLVLSATLLLSWRLVGSEGHGSILLAPLGVLIVLATWSGVEGSPYLEARNVKSWKLQVALCDHVQVCPDEILISVYPNPNEVRNRLAFLRDYRLAHFAPKFSTFVPHDTLDPAFDPKSLPDCAGTLDGVDRLSDGRFQVRGWMIWPDSAGEQPEAISIFSDMGKRLGGGGVCELREDVKRARFMPLPGLIRLRLSGYRAWAAELSEPFYVVGVFANGTRRCKLRSDTSF